MADNFQNFDTVLDSPYKNAFAITPGASEFAISTRGIQVGASGTVSATFVGDSSAVTIYCTQGVVYPYRIKKIDSAVATGIVGLY